jgi:hypothetical protein
MFSGWIIDQNLKPFLETLSGFVQYDLNDSDWDAVSFGIRETDSERDVWFDYRLIGNTTIKLRLAHDVGTSVIFVNVQTGANIGTKVARQSRLCSVTYCVNE